MDARQIEKEYREEQLFQMRESVKAARKAREINTKKKVGDLLDSLYTL